MTQCDNPTIESNASKYILGFSCFGHDSAACLVRDGQIVAAVEEERLTRRKHDGSFPFHSIRSVLKQGDISGSQLCDVIFYENPQIKCERLSQSPLLSKHHQAYKHNTHKLSALIQEACGYQGRLSYCDHHMSHAAGTYYQSPFVDAAILVVDGAGEWAATSLYHGQNNLIAPIQTICYPHSLGLLYSTITSFLGFEPNEGEYKVMGLAAYGRPTQLDALRKLIKLHTDGSFTLDLTFFIFMDDDAPMYSTKLVELLGLPREPESPILQCHMDLASSLQKIMEEALLHLAQNAKAKTGSKNLCLSGSVAHNIVANTKLHNSGTFDEVFVHFASGDSGGAIGAALYAAHQLDIKTKRHITKSSPFLGPAFSDEEAERSLIKSGLFYKKLNREQLIAHVADFLQRGLVVGWHQGRMEFGPRALGNRSLLANAAHPTIKEILNLNVKHREEFRPFAPAVLPEKAMDYFDLPKESPAMLFAAQVHPDKRTTIPGVTHVDGSARPQTVSYEDNPLFYDLIAKFESRTGIPVIVNTSFNVRGEPIVCTPDDAINCFLNTNIDALVIGNLLVVKTAMTPYA
ncbi:MAG: carbamoyltransferase [Alphaproteobacteria bacterium]|nr:carbamoyltransferase [Alphaproteobacteria bacterium]